MSEKRYGTKSEKQKAYRERKKNLSGGEKVAPSSERHVAHDPTQNNLPRENRRTRGSVDAVARPAASGGELAATTSNKSDEWTPATEKSVSGQNFSYDKKKYPNRAAWEIAVQRVERAVRWAKKFPNHIYAGDLKFQTLDWQYENEGLKAPTS